MAKSKEELINHHRAMIRILTGQATTKDMEYVLAELENRVHQIELWMFSVQKGNN